MMAFPELLIIVSILAAVMAPIALLAFIAYRLMKKQKSVQS